MQLTIDIKDSAIDKVMYLLNNLKADVEILDNFDDGFPSISTEEAKERVSKAVNDYKDDKMQVISHNDAWNSIDTNFEKSIENRL